MKQARSHKRTRRLAVAAASLLLTLFGGATPAQAKTVETTWGSKAPGAAGGLFNVPQDVAVRESTDQVYVVDQANNRIQRLNPSGELELAWGWDVVSPGGTGNVAGNEQQVVSVDATGGSFNLTFSRPGAGTSETAGIPRGASPAAFQSALEALPNLDPGDVTVTGSNGGPWTVDFGGPLADVDLPEMGANGFNLTGGPRAITVSTAADGAGFEVCTVAAECKAGTTGDAGGHLNLPEAIAVNQANGHVYVLDRARISQFDADGGFIRAFGWNVVEPTAAGNVSGNERQLVVVHQAAGGTFQLNWESPYGGRGATADIPFDATAAELQTVLEGLDTLLPGDVAVSGAQGGPWTIEFTGALADVNVPVLRGVLEDGSYPDLLPERFSQVGFKTLADGGAFEICSAAAECSAGTRGAVEQPRTVNAGSGTDRPGNSNAGAGGGQVAGGSIAIHPVSGDLFVGSLHRVNEYEGEGAFVRAFGWGVDTGGDQFEICTAASECRQSLPPLSDTFQLDPFPANGQLTEDPQLAVSDAGIVYAAAAYIPDSNDAANPDRRKPFVYRFDSGKALPGEVLLPDPITDGHLAERCSYCTAGPLPDFSDAAGLEIDPDTGHLFYLSDKSQRPFTTGGQTTVVPSAGLLELDASVHPAALVETHMPEPGAIEFSGLGIHNSLDRFYAATFDTAIGHRLLVIGDSPSAPPVVTLKETTGIGADSATLNGEITPNGPGGIETSYRFEYSADGVDWARVPVPDEAIGDGSAPVVVSKPISGLEANLEYRVRLVATKSLGLGTVTSAESVFKTDPLPPTVKTFFPQNRTRSSAKLVATINPNNSPTSYYFEYGETTAYGSRIPVPDGSLNGGSSKKVLEEITGLSPATTYHFRIVATNGIEESPGDVVVEGEDIAFTTRSVRPDPPSRAFEMVTPPFKVVRAPVSQGSRIGFNPNPAIPSLSGDTVAWNVPFFPLTEEVGWPDAGDKRIIRRTPAGWVNETMNTLRLIPGALAWLAKQNGVGSSGDLETVAWTTTGGAATFPEGGGLLPTEGPIANRLYTRRFGTGVEGFTPWLDNPSTQVIGLGVPFGIGGYVSPVDTAVFNDEGTAMARWGKYGGLAEDPATAGDDDPSDNQPLKGLMVYSQRADDADDLPTAPKDLVNECTGSVGGGDATEIPQRNSNGSSNPADDIIGFSACPAGRLTQARGAVVGGFYVDKGGMASTALSDDGRRIFFTSPDTQAGPLSCAEVTSPSQNSGSGTNCPPQLFVRQYGPDGSAVVRWVSRSRSVPGPGGSFSGPMIASQLVAEMGRGVTFEGASRDGRYVYFKTNAPLVPSDPNGGVSITSGAASNASWDLYRYELPASLEADPDDGSLLRISGGPSGSADPNTNPSHDGAGGVTRFVSDDGTRAYFLTGAAIPGADTTPPAGSATAPGGAATGNTTSRNLYLFDENETGADRYRFIARLPFNANSDPNKLNACASFGSALNSHAGTGGGEIIRIHSGNCFRGTPDGKQVIFFTAGQLTGDDDDTAGDIYLYDAESDELTRVTAPPPGATPYLCDNEFYYEPSDIGYCNGDAGFSPAGFGGSAYGNHETGRGWGGFRYTNIARDASGAISVFFESRSELIAADDNGDHWDVYEWREGELSLVSRANPGHHSYLSGNSKDGRDVFLWTTDRIDPRELDDGSYDIYDARIGGGFPYTPPPAPCNVLALACEGGAIAPRATGSAATVGLVGAGNPPPAKARKCRKGKLKRRGRCVTRKCRKGKVVRKGRCVRRKAKKGAKRRAGNGRKGGSR